MLNSNGQPNNSNANGSNASDGAEAMVRVPFRRRAALRGIESLLAEMRSAIIQVIEFLAKENQRYRDQEIERHVVDPIVRGFLATLRRWTQDVAISDAEAKRATNKSTSEVWAQRRDDREADIGELQEELTRLGYSLFVDPIGTSVDAKRHEPAEQIITPKRKRLGLVAKTLRPGCLRADGSVLVKQMVAMWVAGDNK